MGLQVHQQLRARDIAIPPWQGAILAYAAVDTITGDAAQAAVNEGNGTPAFQWRFWQLLNEIEVIGALGGPLSALNSGAGPLNGTLVTEWQFPYWPKSPQFIPVACQGNIPVPVGAATTSPNATATTETTGSLSLTAPALVVALSNNSGATTSVSGSGAGGTWQLDSGYPYCITTGAGSVSCNLSGSSQQWVTTSIAAFGPPATDIAFVKCTPFSEVNSGAAQSVTSTGGNFLICQIGTYSGDNTTSMAVSDSAGNTWTSVSGANVTGVFYTSGGWYGNLWTFYSADAAAITSITITASPITPDNIYFGVLEFSGTTANSYSASIQISTQGLITWQDIPPTTPSISFHGFYSLDA